MAWLALALALAAPDPTAAVVVPWAGGRLYTSPTMHVGARPAVDIAPEGWGVGVTVQVSTPCF